MRQRSTFLQFLADFLFGGLVPALLSRGFFGADQGLDSTAFLGELLHATL